MLNGTAGAMVMLSGCAAVAGGCSASVTFTVKVEVPPPLGVPVMAPVLLFKIKPAAGCRP